MVLVVDDLAAWLIFILAEAGRKKLTSLAFGDDQKRALRPAATEAIQLTAAELCSGDVMRTEELAIMIGQFFKTPVPGASLGEQATLLEAVQVAIAEQLKLVDNPRLAETVKFLTGGRDVSATIVAQKLAAHLLREIVARGSRGGPLAPLANQLNHDRTYLQGLGINDKLLQLLALLGWRHPRGGCGTGGAGPASRSYGGVHRPRPRNGDACQSAGPGELRGTSCRISCGWAPRSRENGSCCGGRT